MRYLQLLFDIHEKNSTVWDGDIIFTHTHTHLQPPASGNVIRWLVCLLRKVINQVLSFVHPRRLHLIRPGSRTSGLTTWGSEAHVLAMRPSCNQPSFPSDWTKEGKKNQRKALSTVATFQSEHEVSPTNPEGQIVERRQRSLQLARGDVSIRHPLRAMHPLAWLFECS